MCFISSPECVYLEQSEPIPTLKNLSCGKCSFQKLTLFSQGDNVMDTSASNLMVFCQEIHVFLQASWISMFWTKWAFLHLEISDWQDVFLSKANSILRRKQCARCFCLAQMILFLEVHVFLPFSSIGLMGIKQAFLHLANSDWQEVFLTKLTHF
jgi:hypothetical protein